MKSSKANSEIESRPSKLGRREFMRLGAGAAAGAAGGVALTALNSRATVQANSVPASPAAQQAAASADHGVPWWAARPAGGKVGKPEAIDLHSHWSPEPYDKALAAMGHPLANPYPLDYDLDKRRQWMDEHGDLMHCLTHSGAYEVSGSLRRGHRAASERSRTCPQGTQPRGQAARRERRAPAGFSRAA